MIDVHRLLQCEKKKIEENEEASDITYWVAVIGTIDTTGCFNSELSISRTRAILIYIFRFVISV